MGFPKLTNVSSLTSLSAHKCTLSGATNWQRLGGSSLHFCTPSTGRSHSPSSTATGREVLLKLSRTTSSILAGTSGHLPQMQQTSCRTAHSLRERLFEREKYEKQPQSVVPMLKRKKQSKQSDIPVFTKALDQDLQRPSR